jgi:hypothetical protein
MRRAVVVEDTVQLCLYEQLGVDTGASEQIQGEWSMWEESVLQIKREVLVGDVQTGNEVIFYRSNGALSRIPAVAVRRKELVVNIDAGRDMLEGVGCFIIELRELWFEATFGQESNGSLIGGENLSAGFALHWFNEDSVAAVVVHY